MVYYAGPMFSEAELAFNVKAAAELEKAGLTVFLPQRDGGRMSEMLKTMTPDEVSREIFRTNMENIRRAEAFLFVLDGRVPDEGACVALGLAYAAGVPCYGLKTDPRTVMDGRMNPMIEGPILRVFASAQEAAAFLAARSA